MKKCGILTFHRSHNCGSMLQAYAIQKIISQLNTRGGVEIIDFNNSSQRNLYQIFHWNFNLKEFIKNIILCRHYFSLSKNYQAYETFISENFKLSKRYLIASDLCDENYEKIVVGSDQIWNITIADNDDAYFLPWVKQSVKVAYAPSFGSKNPVKYSVNIDKYKQWLEDFNYLSIREDNGKLWINQLINKTVSVLLDPTLLLSDTDYSPIISDELILPKSYIFYYAPQYNSDVTNLVKSISHKYRLPVIAFNARRFYLRFLNYRTDFTLPAIEHPGTYLQLIKNATLVVTTSFHGTIFSSIFKKNFWTIKNEGMYEDDDRVISLAKRLDLEERIISTNYSDSMDYLEKKDFSNYDKLLRVYKEESLSFLRSALNHGDSEN